MDAEIKIGDHWTHKGSFAGYQAEHPLAITSVTATKPDAAPVRLDAQHRYRQVLEASPDRVVYRMFRCNSGPATPTGIAVVMERDRANDVRRYTAVADTWK